MSSKEEIEKESYEAVSGTAEEIKKECAQVPLTRRKKSASYHLNFPQGTASIKPSSTSEVRKRWQNSTRIRRDLVWAERGSGFGSN